MIVQTIEPVRGEEGTWQPRLRAARLLGTGTERASVRAHGHARARLCVCVRVGGVHTKLHHSGSARLS